MEISDPLTTSTKGLITCVYNNLGQNDASIYQTSLFASSNSLSVSTITSGYSDATRAGSRLLTYKTSDFNASTILPFVLGWINSGQRIVGATGETGSVYYATGPQGPQGDAGASFTGPQGPQGNDGTSATAITTYPIEFTDSALTAPTYTTSSLGYQYVATVSISSPTLTSGLTSFVDVASISLQTFGSFFISSKVRIRNSPNSSTGAEIQLTHILVQLRKGSTTFHEVLQLWPSSDPLILLPGEYIDIPCYISFIPGNSADQTISLRVSSVFSSTSDAVAEVKSDSALLDSRLEIVRLG